MTSGQAGGGQGPDERDSQGRYGNDRAATWAFVGVAVLLAIAFAGRRDLAHLDRAIGHRTSGLQARLAQAVGTQGTLVPPPDPDRVYPLGTDGAPSRGNPAAPVTIVEFGDFQ
jgi:hypothetical protein